MVNSFKTLLSALLLFLSWSTTVAHAARDREVSLPSGTVEGWLANGLHYLILPNDLPRHEVELRLVMQVGSLQEDDHQGGGAHFLEHMAFAGTRHFPGNAWVDFFERMGMKYGRDINAFTGFDRTIYWLTLPADECQGTMMDSTLLAVRDVIDGICFDSLRMESERGVIEEELRGYSTGDDFYSLKIGRGRQPQRMPLGSAADIRSIPRTALRRFYADWYLPRFATLILVGNVDSRDAEMRIRQAFSSIHKDRKEARIKHFPLVYDANVTTQYTTDATASQASQIELIIPHTSQPACTIAQTIEKERLSLLMRMLRARFTACGIHTDLTDAWYLATTSHLSLTSRGAHRDSSLSALSRALSLMYETARHGFSRSEIDDAAQQRASALRKQQTEGMLSSKWVDDFVDYVISSDRYIAAPADADAVAQGLLHTSSRQLQRMLSQLLRQGEKQLLVAVCDKEEADSIPTHLIRSLWQRAEKASIPPYCYQRGSAAAQKLEAEESVAVPSCLSERHSQLSATDSTFYPDLGATLYRLPNGLQIISRPTLDTDSMLYVSLLGRGGLADLSEHDYTQLKDAVGYVDMGGLVHAPTDSLQETMIAHSLGMSVGVDDYWHQVLASAPVKHAQELYNMVYEKISAPGRDEEGFTEARESELDHIGEKSPLELKLEHDPDRMLSRRADSLLANSPSAAYRTTSREALQGMNLDSLTRYYVRLFSNPRQATLVLTGGFHAVPSVVQRAIDTFGRLQLAPADTLPLRQDRASLPKANYTEVFENGVEGQTVFNFIYPGHYVPGLRQSLTLKLMRDILQNRLLSVMREEMNIVYSPYADLYYAGLPQQKYYFWLTIAVKDDNRTAAQQALKRIIDDLQRNPVQATELNKLKRSFVVTKRKSLSDVASSEWKSALTSLVRNGESLSDFDAYAACLESITPADVCRAFNQYINPEQLVLLTKE